MLKVCKICRIEKPLSEFYFRKDNNKYRPECKTCISQKMNDNYKKKREHYKIIRKIYYEKNRDKFIRDVNEDYLKNREKRLIQMKEYRLKNVDVEKERERIRKRDHRLYYNNIDYKIRRLLRARIALIIKSNGGKRSCNSIELLGCSIQEARKHIESQFKSGMTWDNHGEWHIDHIKPLKHFDLTKPKEQKKAFNYKNLQPLWAKDNLSKGAKILKEAVND